MRGGQQGIEGRLPGRGGREAKKVPSRALMMKGWVEVNPSLWGAEEPLVTGQRPFLRLTGPQRCLWEETEAA